MHHTDTEQFPSFIKDLYQRAVLTADSQLFRQQTYQKLQQWLPFDAAIWLTRRETKSRFFKMETFTFNLPNTFMESYDRFLNNPENGSDPVAQYAAQRPNEIVTLVDVFGDIEHYHQSKVYQLHAQHFDIQQVFGGWMENPDDRKINIYSFYQFSRHQPLSSDNISVLQALLPHLSQSMSLHLLAKFSHPSQPNAQHIALFDLFGNVLEIKPGLKIACIQPLLSQISAICQHQLNTKAHYPLNDQYQLYKDVEQHIITLIKQPSSATATLTAKQQAICQRLCLGETDKQIAKHLQLSPYTISNHLKRIFKVLGTRNRHETIALLNDLQ